MRRVRIVREWLFSEPAEDGTRQVIGPHYFLLRDFTPFMAPPTVHEQEDDGLSTPENRRTFAEQNRFMYEEYLKRQNLKESHKDRRRTFTLARLALTRQARPSSR